MGREEKARGGRSNYDGRGGEGSLKQERKMGETMSGRMRFRRTHKDNGKSVTSREQGYLVRIRI